jgi:hypothetical protein
LGNHETATYFYTRPPNYEIQEAVRGALTGLGIKILENSSKKVTVGEQSFYLIGLGDLWSKTLDVEKAFADLNDDDLARIVLVHNPDAIIEMKAKNKTADLFLAGHTHGGQVRLPIFGPIGIIPTKLGQKYDKGWFDFGGIKMFITSGLGETSARARLFNLPEIVLLTIY